VPLAPGEKLGPYEILAPIGKGGMGEVYRAHDSRLKRDVAIKVSSEQFSERFEQEARSIAALNHPNICHLYDIGPNYLVMELVEGSPIAAADGVRKLLDLAVQIADGLAAAHAAGIVHRDLKPDNILVTRDGRVKILDFGLAKSVSARLADDATFTMGLTNPGTVVGTVNYMSPEQARGEVDLAAQSDQFSFGLVLYELATGKRAFQRGSAAETMTAIIREDAEPLPGSVPAPLRWAIERLLAKEPSERYDSTRDLYRELKQIRDRLSSSASAEIPAVPFAPRRKRGLILGAGAFACLAAGSAFTLFLKPPPGADPDLSAYKFTSLSRAETEERSPRWSPDGKSIAYTARIHGVLQVFTRMAGAPDAVQLTNARQHCSLPFWPPDGASVYYISGGRRRSNGVGGSRCRRAPSRWPNAGVQPRPQVVDRIFEGWCVERALGRSYQWRVEFLARRLDAGCRQHRTRLVFSVSIRHAAKVRVGRSCDGRPKLVSGQPPCGGGPAQKWRHGPFDRRCSGWNPPHDRLGSHRIPGAIGVTGGKAHCVCGRSVRMGRARNFPSRGPGGNAHFRRRLDDTGLGALGNPFHLFHPYRSRRRD
jgi:serine/threonine protein kinase